VQRDAILGGNLDTPVVCYLTTQKLGGEHLSRRSEGFFRKIQRRKPKVLVCALERSFSLAARLCQRPWARTKAACGSGDNPELRGKPLASAAPQQQAWLRLQATKNGKYGVHLAMPSVTAAGKCPDLISVTPRFEVSRFIASSPSTHHLIEPLSLDQAYLHVTENLRDSRSRPRSRWRSAGRSRRSPGSTRQAESLTTRFSPKGPAN
jgi:hypothetical protein